MEQGALNNKGIAAEQLIVEEGGQAAGRDIHNSYENNYYESNSNENRSGFASINPSAYSSEYYTSPVFTGMLAEQVKDRRLIVVAGGQGFDKGAFIRHLASRIVEDIPGMLVKEWRDAEGEDKIENEIRETETSCIFILNETVPKHVSYNLGNLAATARQYGHIVLMTTEMTVDTWQLIEAIARLYWFDVPLTGLYSKEAIAEIFYRRLDRSRKLFAISQEEAITPGLTIAGKYSAATIASSFETPDQVEFFMTLIEADNTSGGEEKISNAITTVVDKSDTLVTKWYRTLSPGEKLIALGAALLDGLFDDQFFAVMQKIVEDFWHYREKNLRSLDYCDIEFLFNFFKFETYDDGRQVLVSKFPNQRAEVIRAAWSGHKRHILSAFSVLTLLASRSARRKNAEDFDIYGTTERGMRLRVTAADTISDIGIVSLATAEPKLIELAIAGDVTIRRVTAKAMARWRAFRKDEQMFATLERWILQDNSNLRSGAILTLQYAAEYDSPGHLDPRIMSILAELGGDERLLPAMKEILPSLIDQHSLHIAEWIGDHFACRKYYRQVLADSLLRLPHPDLRKMIDGWLEAYRSDSSRDNRRQEFTRRDNVIALILELFRRIEYTGKDDTINIEYVWNVLQTLHDSEERRSMRAFVLTTAAFMVGVQPDKALAYLEPIFRRVGTEDRYLIIEGIGEAYLQQRRNLEGGQYTIIVNEVSYPVWYNTSRPLTTIEKTLFAWLPGSSSFAREIATLSFVHFARILDYEERILIPQAVSQAMEKERQETVRAQQQAMEKARASVVVFPVIPELSLWTEIKIFFWLLFKSSDDRIVLREVMNILLMYKQTNPALLNVIIARWSRQSHERTRLLAWWVEKLKSF